MDSRHLIRAGLLHRVFPSNMLSMESRCRIGYGPTKNESRSLLAVDILGHQRGGFCICAGDKMGRTVQTFSTWGKVSRGTALDCW